MTEPRPVEFTEDGVPVEGIEENVAELVELYGGEITAAPGERERTFTLPLRRGVAAAGAIECRLTWTDGETLTLACDREVDAPKFQRILILGAGVIGSLLFLIWPFYPPARQLGALAWIGGAIAIAAYFLTLRRSSGGIAFDFLHRLARRQRESHAAGEAATDAP